MKRSFCFIILIGFLNSCDVLEGPYMDDTVNPIDTSGNEYVKNILIEDFTAHRCSNCPNAAREIEAIHDVYGSRIISLAIHAGFQFAYPYPLDTTVNPNQKFTYDFRTIWGDEMDTEFGLSASGLPNGMINRIDWTENGGDHRKAVSQWASITADELNKEVQFGININSTVVTADLINITIDTEALTSLSGNYRLVVCLSENNIINWQTDGTYEDSDYVHKHVLRSLLTTSWGDDLTSSSINNGDSFNHTYSLDLSDLEDNNIQNSLSMNQGNGNSGGWDANNLYVIAYVYDVSNYEILQVEEKSLLAK